ncbi:hypothetical protein AN416_38130 (plasmid) [Paraburkholderia caribensis]|nr:hypothetical protein AN416_38130 [Paraburkholderia caribensis]AUT57905.1 hypothetical protein C2L66_39105 [Paraburkholderia caribensis]
MFGFGSGVVTAFSFTGEPYAAQLQQIRRLGACRNDHIRSQIFDVLVITRSSLSCGRSSHEALARCLDDEAANAVATTVSLCEGHK